MKNKAVLLVLFSILSISLIAAITLLILKQNVTVKTQVTNQFSEILELSRENYQKDLLGILQKYGYQDLYKEIEDDNVNIIKSIVTDISTKDYNSLYKIMKESGNVNVVRTLDSIKKEDPSVVYDVDDEVESCH